MKQKTVTFCRLDGKPTTGEVLVRTTEDTLDGRTIEEICNDGDAQMDDFIDNNRNRKHHLKQNFSENLEQENKPV